MDPSNPYRPRVSRETRLLLTAGVIAIAALWLLARVRFQERPLTPNPVPSVLSQLAGGPRYDDLAAEIARLQVRVEPDLVLLNLPSTAPLSSPTSRPLLALRFRDDLAVTLLPAGSSPDLWNDSRIVARDPASNLLVVRIPSQVPALPPVTWTPGQTQQPRYLMASDPSSHGVSLRPVFVGSLDPVDSPWWPDPVFAVPGRSDLTPGSFVFTSGAEFVGLVLAHGADTVVLPGATLLSEVDRLVNASQVRPGTVGLEVQALTERLASVTGASAGVVVTWVEPGGAAAGHLAVGDVIETVDGRGLATREHWDVRLVRLLAGETLTLRVRRGGEIREVALVATAVAAVRPVAVSRSLGLTLRARTGIGAEVIRVQRGSAGDRAGLSVGDVITLAADVPAPTPAQVGAVFRPLREGQRVMIAVTRGDVHHVMTLEP